MAASQRVDSMDSKGMQFAKQQLEKFGWKEGSGLGRNSTGITAALKPKLKFDAAGLGHKQSEELLYEWWNHAFNKAAQSFDVQTTEDGAAVIRKDTVGKISNKKQVSTNVNLMNNYGSFHKAGTLTSGKLVEEDRSVPAVFEEKEYFVKLSDEELFKKCGGRTAHKGARHGHRCKGKLARVAEQEALLLATLYKSEKQEEEKKGVEIKDKGQKKIKKTRGEEQEMDGSKENEEVNVRPKKSKKKDKSSACDDTVVSSATEISTNDVSNDVPEKKKKKKRKHQETEVDLPLEEQVDMPKKPKKKKKNKENIDLSLGTNFVDSCLTSDVVEVSETSEKKKKKKKKKENEEKDSLEEEVRNIDVEQTDVKKRKKQKKRTEE